MKNNQFQGTAHQRFLKGSSLGSAATLGAPGIISAQSGPQKAKKDFTEKIDIFCHILPQKYNEAVVARSGWTIQKVDTISGRAFLYI